MYFGAEAIEAGIEQRVRCRNPNLVRTACVCRHGWRNSKFKPWHANSLSES